MLSTLPDDLTGTVTHGSDVPYLLELAPGQPSLDAAQAALADTLRASWVAFAATGDPSTGDDPWQPVSEDGAAMRVLSTGLDAIVVDDLVAAHRCDLWRS